MRVGIRAKQVAGVVAIVGASALVLSAVHLASVARVSLGETQARAELLANAIYHRARAAIALQADPRMALREDAGLRSILESSVYSPGVTYAAIVGRDGVSVADSDPLREGSPLPPAEDLAGLLELGRARQWLAMYRSAGRTVEWRKPLLLDGAEFGSIRIGISTLLARRELDAALKPAAVAALAALAGASFIALLFAQIMLKPIHVLRSGLSRLGRGEVGVTLDLPQRDEFGDLGASFNTLSAHLAAGRSEAAGERAHLASIVEHLEDAVALVGADGTLLFANSAMRAAMPPQPVGRHVSDLLPPPHPYRSLLETTLLTHESTSPRQIRILREAGPGAQAGDGGESDHLVLTHAIHGPNRAFVGVMLVARDLEYLGQVQSSVNYSRRLAAIGRLTAGVAHEVKNPLNAMTIHLELLRQKLNGTPAARARRGRLAAEGNGRDEPAAPDIAGALEHAGVIAGEIRRLDEVLQGFIKFTRPEELTLSPIRVADLVGEVVTTIAPQTEQGGVTIRTEGLEQAPDINGDHGLLRQALLNLALNACQAMPSGGTLRIFARPARGRRVEIGVEDTGVGIKPEHLEKIYNLYFTTREQGSGMGLAMVYRTVQLHGGEIEARSVEGRGTTFRVMLPRV